KIVLLMKDFGHRRHNKASQQGVTKQGVTTRPHNKALPISVNTRRCQLATTQGVANWRHKGLTNRRHNKGPNKAS
ncbi:hypothetical protein Bpfe_002640, partial [Biomphalaria pfeifferi]